MRPGPAVEHRELRVEIRDDAQVAVLRGMSGADRLRIASGMFRAARKMLESDLAARHHEWDEERLRAEVEAVRGLRFLADVQCETVTQAHAGEATTEGMDDEEGAESRRARTRGLTRLGLVQSAQDVGAARAEARRAGVAGYYDSAQRKFFVVAAVTVELESVISSPKPVRKRVANMPSSVTVPS